MRRFTVPAAYRRYVEAAIAMAVADAGKDASWRSDEDPVIRRFAKVPKELLDADAIGEVEVIIGVVEDSSALVAGAIPAAKGVAA